VSDLLSGPDPLSCQVVQAPAGDGRRLVPDDDAGAAAGNPSASPAFSLGADEADQEIRLTYRELSALIEDAIRSLK
jgi:hypothetical protein